MTRTIIAAPFPRTCESGVFGRTPPAPRQRGANTRLVVGNVAHDCQRGFSLLEVLVAFVILSLVVTALFRLFSGALANASAADDYSRAVLVAETVLAEAAVTRPLREATQTGSADGDRIAWTTHVAPQTPPDVPLDLERAAETMPTRLYRITVEVAFPAPTGGRRTFALATTRIGARDPR